MDNDNFGYIYDSIKLLEKVVNGLSANNGSDRWEEECKNAIHSIKLDEIERTITVQKLDDGQKEWVSSHLKELLEKANWDIIPLLNGFSKLYFDSERRCNNVQSMRLLTISVLEDLISKVANPNNQDSGDEDNEPPKTPAFDFLFVNVGTKTKAKFLRFFTSQHGNTRITPTDVVTILIMLVGKNRVDELKKNNLNAKHLWNELRVLNVIGGIIHDVTDRTLNIALRKGENCKPKPDIKKMWDSFK